MLVFLLWKFHYLPITFNLHYEEFFYFQTRNYFDSLFKIQNRVLSSSEVNFKILNVSIIDKTYFSKCLISRLVEITLKLHSSSLLMLHIINKFARLKKPLILRLIFFLLINFTWTWVNFRLKYTFFYSFLSNHSHTCNLEVNYAHLHVNLVVNDFAEWEPVCMWICREGCIRQSQLLCWCIYCARSAASAADGGWVRITENPIEWSFSQKSIEFCCLLRIIRSA